MNKQTKKQIPRYSIELTFHIEPFEGRNPRKVREDIEYIFNQYGSHPALYRFPTSKGSFLSFILLKKKRKKRKKVVFFLKKKRKRKRKRKRKKKKEKKN